MISPDPRYTPEPGCSSLRIIVTVAIQGPPLSFRSAALELTGAKHAVARQSASAAMAWGVPPRNQGNFMRSRTARRIKTMAFSLLTPLRLSNGSLGASPAGDGGRE